MLYLSLVKSHLTYCSQLWRPKLIKDMKSLEKVQRRATKYILNDYVSDYKARLHTFHNKHTCSSNHLMRGNNCSLQSLACGGLYTAGQDVAYCLAGHRIEILSNAKKTHLECMHAWLLQSPAHACRV